MSEQSLVRVSLDPVYEKATLRIGNAIREVPFLRTASRAECEEYVLWLCCTLAHEMGAGVTFEARALWSVALGMMICEVEGWRVADDGAFVSQKVMLVDVDRVPSAPVIQAHVEKIRKLIQEMTK